MRCLPFLALTACMKQLAPVEPFAEVSHQPAWAAGYPVAVGTDFDLFTRWSTYCEEVDVVTVVLPKLRHAQPCNEVAYSVDVECENGTCDFLACRDEETRL